jgi:23S rRNA (guanosine2251-2'-O)-methyltransferase
VGTTGSADKTLKGLDCKGALAIVMGTEGTGLKQLTLKTCDDLIKIPMQGAMPSLNVSVATGVCLYEVARQRGS